MLYKVLIECYIETDSFDPTGLNASELCEQVVMMLDDCTVRAEKINIIDLKGEV